MKFSNKTPNVFYFTHLWKFWSGITFYFTFFTFLCPPLARPLSFSVSHFVLIIYKSPHCSFAKSGSCLGLYSSSWQNLIFTNHQYAQQKTRWDSRQMDRVTSKVALWRKRVTDRATAKKTGMYGWHRNWKWNALNTQRGGSAEWEKADRITDNAKRKRKNGRQSIKKTTKNKQNKTGKHNTTHILHIQHNYLCQCCRVTDCYIIFSINSLSGYIFLEQLFNFCGWEIVIWQQWQGELGVV